MNPAGQQQPPKIIRWINEETKAFNKAKKLHNRLVIAMLAALAVMITADVLEAPTWIDITTSILFAVVLFAAFWAGDEKHEKHGRIDGATDFILMVLEDIGKVPPKQTEPAAKSNVQQKAPNKAATPRPKTKTSKR